MSDIPTSMIADKDIECFKFYYIFKPNFDLESKEVDTTPFLMSPYAKSRIYLIPCWLDDYGKLDNPNVSTVITKCKKDNIFRHIIEKGYIHSCYKITDLTHYNLFLTYGTVIVKCKIPNGSEYFVSYDNESLCSKELIIEEIIYPNMLKEFSVPLPLIKRYKKVFNYKAVKEFQDNCKN